MVYWVFIGYLSFVGAIGDTQGGPGGQGGKLENRDILVRLIFQMGAIGKFQWLTPHATDPSSAVTVQRIVDVGDQNLKIWVHLGSQNNWF